MVLFKLLFWLLALPFRLLFWVVGWTLWLLFLPLRLVFALLGFIGVGRLLQLGALAAIGYYVYRLMNEETERPDAFEPAPELREPTSPTSPPEPTSPAHGPQAT
jgi:hypothetical protein